MSKILQDVNVGANIRSLRKLCKLSQDELCAKMATENRPMTQSTLTLIETGKRNIFASDMIAFKRVLDTSYDEIFKGLEPVSRYEQE